MVYKKIVVDIIHFTEKIVILYPHCMKTATLTVVILYLI